MDGISSCEPIWNVISVWLPMVIVGGLTMSVVFKTLYSTMRGSLTHFDLYERCHLMKEGVVFYFLLDLVSLYFSV